MPLGAHFSGEIASWLDLACFNFFHAVRPPDRRGKQNPDRHDLQAERERESNFTLYFDYVVKTATKSAKFLSEALFKSRRGDHQVGPDGSQ